MLVLIGLETKLPGPTWDHFRCTVEPSPGHIRCRSLHDNDSRSRWLLKQIRVSARKTTMLPHYLCLSICFVAVYLYGSNCLLVCVRPRLSLSLSLSLFLFPPSLSLSLSPISLSLSPIYIYIYIYLSLSLSIPHLSPLYLCLLSLSISICVFSLSPYISLFASLTKGRTWLLSLGVPGSPKNVLFTIAQAFFSLAQIL